MPGKQDWETPWELFNNLDSHFNFTIDAAASESNAKCSAYITETDNALSIELEGETIWCNPPYANMSPWADCFLHWQLTGNQVVCLVQDKTDTAWFRQLWQASSEVVFLYPRVQFIGPGVANMHGAVVMWLDFVVLKPLEPVVRFWDWRTTY